MVTNNLELVKYLKSKLELPTMYMLGSVGRMLTHAAVDARIAKGDKHTIANEKIIRAAVGKAYSFDCNTLAKASKWEISPGVIKYDAKIDLGSKSLYNLSKKKGPTSTMPNMPGLIVWTADLGHMGFFIEKKDGINQYIEATPAWGAWGVTTSADKNHPKGHNRKWAYWGEYHLIDYIKEEVKPIPGELKVGDQVTWAGYLYKDSYGGGRQAKYLERKGTVTILNNNPYGVHIDKLGWISRSQIMDLSNDTQTEPSKVTFKVGDKINIIGSHYATGQKIPAWVKKDKHTVREVYKDKLLLKEIYSWVFMKDVKKV